MNLTEIDDGVFVCGQITEDFVGELAKAGFKTIICNRPDNEQQNQPTYSSIATLFSQLFYGISGSLRKYQLNHNGR